jgi:hypothetical protein
VFVISAVRTPVGRQVGYLCSWMDPELLCVLLDEVFSQIDLDPSLV